MNAKCDGTPRDLAPPLTLTVDPPAAYDVAPATFNTINKSAAGINDTLVLGLINEALGSPSIPIALLPWVNGSLNEHPAYQPGLARLRDAGVHIIVPSSNDLEAFDQACVAAGNWLKLAGSDSPSSCGGPGHWR